ILAGGHGSRFWPLSRVLEPKQFISLLHDKTLFEKTISRVSCFIKPENIYIATSELYRYQILNLAKNAQIPDTNIIFEPVGKNTAASIAVAARIISVRDPKASMCVLPCDHRIEDHNKFVKLLEKAFLSCHDKIVVLGIKPYRPATGYGYIEAGRIISGALNRVNRFCEKPDIKTAKKFIINKNYFWNSGIFCGKAVVFLEEFKAHLPGMFRGINKINSADQIKKVWGGLTQISFDYGVLEKSKRLAMIKATGLGWSDLGSWQAWDELLGKDKDGNLLEGDVVNIGSQNTTVLAAKRFIAAIGLQDLIVVDTPDALLITKKEESEKVKTIVDRLIKKQRSEQYEHKTVKRPWGEYTVLDIGSGFKVKLVVVDPGQSLSLQYHQKRSEHWVVVEGVAKILEGKRSFILHANKSAYVPVGCVHRVSNHGKTPLKIVEVQAGSVLSEDDIVRLKDNFGRK
ncbi:MAG: mannose-1-phosphate guanylyltransferase/mannose-6-phosphate isomerase, partial [Candidatus Omnitrophica bacterium]|nr:mannose-1-phosphate guanylyltransferase/mannose-6-phosphate isomerase [Candidatus Omnitrophota bacterium]